MQGQTDGTGGDQKKHGMFDKLQNWIGGGSSGGTGGSGLNNG